jgi:two-component system nitrate/nitrite response regulator NarL
VWCISIPSGAEMSVLSKRFPAALRVLLVVKQAIAREGLRLLLETRVGAAVVGETSSSEEAVAAGIPDVDLILFDTDLDDPSSFEAIERLIAAAAGGKLVVLTGSADQQAHCRVMRLGAMGLVLKERPTEVLVKAIEKVCSGEVWFDRSTMARMLAGMSGAAAAQDREAAGIATLTDRERQVVALVGEGLKNRSIAERLFISEITVRHHVTSIISKLGVSDRLELLIYAYRHKLAKPPI